MHGRTFTTTRPTTTAEASGTVSVGTSVATNNTGPSASRENSISEAVVKGVDSTGEEKEGTVGEKRQLPDAATVGAVSLKKARRITPVLLSTSASPSPGNLVTVPFVPSSPKAQQTAAL